MLTLEAGDARAGIALHAGGRLGSLVVRGRELLVGPSGPDDRSIRWGCYLMAPWPGRLANAAFAWRGSVIRLPRTHGGHAIHGLVWDAPWRVDAATPSRAELSCDLPAAWPMGGTVHQSFTLTSTHLVMEARIVAAQPMPAALGWHPWFARGDGAVRLRLDAPATMETRAMIPTGRTLPVSGSRDLRAEPMLGRRRLDHAYLGARSPAVLSWPDLSLTLAFEPSPATVVVHTPARGICVEPQTAPPNALALPESEALAAGVRLLEAGESLAARFEIGWT